MKNLKSILAFSLLLAVVISCDSDDDEPAQEIILKKETINAKWVVSDASGRTNSNTFASFEFNLNGNYIVVSGETVLFGTYEIKDNQTILLNDLGTLTVLAIDADNFKFTFTTITNPGATITVSATKATEMVSTSKTDLLCQTWELVTYNGAPATGTENELTVLFSKAGTYFVSLAQPDDEDDGGLAQWRWKDGNESTICYSWEGEPACNEDNQVTIAELTSTSLKMIEGEYTYILKPVTASTGRIHSPDNKAAGMLLKQGFFKK